MDYDLANMADKAWRRPGSDISDWFNYGFDEISWEAYCYRRREIGEVANVLKANVLVRCAHACSLATLQGADDGIPWIELRRTAGRPTQPTAPRNATDGHGRHERYDE